MSECPICGRDVSGDGEFCRYHAEAQNNIKIAFDDWNHALEIDWSVYLEKLLDEEHIGKWAREVVEYLTQQDGS